MTMAIAHRISISPVFSVAGSSEPDAVLPSSAGREQCGLGRVWFPLGIYGARFMKEEFYIYEVLNETYL